MAAGSCARRASRGSCSAADEPVEPELGSRGGSDPRRVTGHLVRSHGRRARGASGETGLVDFSTGAGMSSTGCIRWRTRWGFTAVVAAAGLAAAVPSSVGAPTADTHLQRVIVSGTSGALQQVEHAVRTSGGHITKVLRVVDGVTARVPASSVPTLRSVPGVRSVTPDTTGHLMGINIDSTLGYDVQNDEGSLFDVAQITHAR